MSTSGGRLTCRQWAVISTSMCTDRSRPRIKEVKTTLAVSSTRSHHVKTPGMYSNAGKVRRAVLIFYYRNKNNCSLIFFQGQRSKEVSTCIMASSTALPVSSNSVVTSRMWHGRCSRVCSNAGPRWRVWESSSPHSKIRGQPLDLDVALPVLQIRCI